MVNSIEPSPSVRVPCLNYHHTDTLTFKLTHYISLSNMCRYIVKKLQITKFQVAIISVMFAITSQLLTQ
jgi:hypothetical protein